MEQKLNAGLKDIFSTILKGAVQGSNPPQVIVLQGNGHVFAPGGTVHVWRHLPNEGAKPED